MILKKKPYTYIWIMSLISIHSSLYPATQLHHQEENLNEIQEEIMAADAVYEAQFGDKGSLTMYSKKKWAILTCMDPRIDPAKILDLEEGDAYVIRNAGGRASDDAIRSLVVSSKLLGTNSWVVIHHTDCGMQTFTNSVMRKLLKESLHTATRDYNGHWFNSEYGHGSSEGGFINWLTINSPIEQSVATDVRRLRNHPLVSKKIAIYGYVYDVKTGHLNPIERAMKIGAPQK